jgi:hypothetical protein
LDPCSTNYSRVAGARLWLHPEELPEQDPVGLDPQECFTKMDKDRGMENTVRVDIEVLNSVVPEEAFEEVAGRKRESALCEAREHRDLVFSFSIGYGSPAAALHISTSFSQINPLLRRVNKSSVFTFDFFHSQLGSGRGGDIGGAAPVAATAASSQPLFFPVVFADLDGDGFILHVHGVFTRIRSGATLAALGGGTSGSTATAARVDLFKWLQQRLVENPKGFGIYL